VKIVFLASGLNDMTLTIDLDVDLLWPPFVMMDGKQERDGADELTNEHVC